MKISQIIIMIIAAICIGCIEQKKPNPYDEAAYENAAYVLRNVLPPAYPDYKERFKEAVVTLDGLIRRHPREAKYYALRAKAYLELGLSEDENSRERLVLHRKAERDTNRALRINSDLPELFFYFYYIADTEDEQLEVIKQYVEKYPEFIEPYQKRVFLNLNNEELKAQTQADLDKIIELQPGYCEYYGTRAFFHLHHGSYTKALEDAEKALELGDKCDSTLFVRALALREAGRYEEAIQTIDDFMACPVKIGEVTPSAGYVYRGIFHCALRKPDNAIEDSKKALAAEDLREDFREIAYVNIVSAYQYKGDMENMKRYLKEFRQNYPDSKGLPQFEDK